MAKKLNVSITAKIAWAFSNVGNIQSPKDSNSLPQSKITLTTGTGNFQGNELWADMRLVTTGSPTDVLDLLGGLSDIFGTALNFSKIKYLGIFNNGTPNAAGGFDMNFDAVLLVGAGGIHAWSAPFSGNQSAQVPIDPGGKFELCCPMTGLSVVSNSSHLLQLAHSGTHDISYSIAIVGVM